MCYELAATIAPILVLKLLNLTYQGVIQSCSLCLLHAAEKLQKLTLLVHASHEGKPLTHVRLTVQLFCLFFLFFVVSSVCKRSF